ncbi:MAG: 50S ribosomal protein L13 [Patescibacteria group bacterium]|jgi:large subunit ribosomal protein L13
MYKKPTTTKRPTKKELPEKWYLIDAAGKTLGRLASKLATILMGKTAATYDPAVLTPIKIVVTNASQIKVTGKKLTQKKYYRHSGYMGGLKTTSLEETLAKKPTKALEAAVSGMLPKNRLRRLRLANLKIYAGAEHQHMAQKPDILEL